MFPSIRQTAQPLWALAGPIVRRDRPRNPRENVKLRLGHVFVRFLRDQEFCENVLNLGLSMFLGVFLGETDPPQKCETQAWACFWALSGETDPGIPPKCETWAWACLRKLHVGLIPFLWLGAHRDLRLRRLQAYRQAGFRVWCCLFRFRWVAS